MTGQDIRNQASADITPDEAIALTASGEYRLANRAESGRAATAGERILAVDAASLRHFAANQRQINALAAEIADLEGRLDRLGAAFGSFQGASVAEYMEDSDALNREFGALTGRSEAASGRLRALAPYLFSTEAVEPEPGSTQGAPARLRDGCMEVKVGEGLSIKSFPDQDQALETSALSPALRRLVQDQISVSPCYLRVVEQGQEHYFAAFFLEQWDGAGQKVGEALLLAVHEGAETSERYVWVPPRLSEEERFSLVHLNRGQVEKLKGIC